jgi:hypothetical protein
MYSNLTLPYQLALQPFVGLGLLHQQPPSTSVHCSGSPVFNFQYPKVSSDIIKPPQFWSTSYSFSIDLLIKDCPWHSVSIHSFYMSHQIYSSCIYRSNYIFFLQYLIYQQYIIKNNMRLLLTHCVGKCGVKEYGYRTKKNP